ncbi:MAG: tyrosine-protein phosphatase [Clostridiales bacterium]|jgi:protein-tyrosine phosphatase|nr:tyrosine-protein phosphatase [Clostridiales bacterium]
MFARRLPLRTTFNTRDLGGYWGKRGVTKYGRFLRSGDVSRCGEADIAALARYGVKTVIDLRGQRECEFYPNVFPSGEIRCLNIPLIPDELMYSEGFDLLGLARIYTDIILENSNGIRQLFSALAKGVSPDGTPSAGSAVLFHCSAGKDRTGIAAMLLLMLAEVDLYDIMADYQVSFTYNKVSNDSFLREHPTADINMLKSEPEWIAAAYRKIRQDGGAVEYLARAGVTEEEIKTITVALLGEDALR